MVRTAREVAPLERVQALQSHLASSTDLNSITELIKQIEELHTQLEEVDDQRSHIKALTLATRVVSQALVTLSDKGTFDTDLTDADGRLVLQEASDAKTKVSRWLRQQWNTFVSLILDELLYSEFAPIRQAALEVCMALQTASSEALHKHGTIKSGRWSVTPFRPLVQTVLWRQVPDDVLETLAEEYLEVYDDVRFFFCKEVSRVLRNVPDASIKNERVRSHARALLSRITAIPTDPSHLNNFLIPHLSHAPKKKKSNKKPKLTVSQDGDDDDGIIEAEPTLSESDEEKEDEDSGSRKRRRSRHGHVTDALHTLGSQRQVFAAAWLSLLLPSTHVDVNGQRIVHGGKLSTAETHDILVRLHAQILPHLPNPSMLHDFLVDCLDTKGTTALLALNGLFTLIVHHNLDYPDFYTRLYALLDASVLHTRYRSRFMRMLDTFLSSMLLPVAIVASFAKRLSRLSLRATPAALVEIIPFIWNMLKHHPSCMQMIHRDWDGDHLALGPSGVQDPFDSHEPNPLFTHALESSLWEISTFGAYHLSQSSQHGKSATDGGDTHYLGSVTSFASIFAEPFTQQRYELEDFLDTTYSTMFENETRKTLKRRNSSNKPVVPPALNSLDLTLTVPPILAEKSGHHDAAVRREIRKRLQMYAFPSTDPPQGDTPLEQDRRALRLDDCARLWNIF